MIKSILKYFGNDNKDKNNIEKFQKNNKLIIGIVLLTILFAFLFLTDNSPKKEERNIGNFNLVENDKTAKTRWVGEAVDDLSLAKKRVDNLDNRNQKLEQQLQDLRKLVNDLKKEQADNASKNAEQMKNYMENMKNQQDIENKENKEKTTDNLYENFPEPSLEQNKTHGLSYLGNVPQIEQIEQIRYTPMQGTLNYTNIAQPSPKEEPEKELVKHILPTGTIIKAILLSGMDAPTMAQAKTSPLPVLMKVSDLSILPNRWTYNINECFLMGEGYGDLTSERAYIRINNISCITNKGEHIDMLMKGVATGEDGKLGLKGEVVTKQGALLARTLVAGFLEGVGESFAKQNEIVTQGWGGTVTTNNTVSPSESIQAGAFQGLSKSAEKLADFYLKMADQVTPVIEISAGREVDVITTATTDLKTIEQQYKEDHKGTK
ncbi:sex pilus assembly protein [Campylobacter insulaenigrae]|uniref:TrbI/VirB10 family protein n=1 Tax=Campylobacter insulaenigrae TaxID=260714 RepID=UPI000F718044|nr:TrbI/VirB10 family protein [Campylobacter insulaenigrae]MCR6591882.1 conjugal transfer protein TraB [Campylobacter insulaenigrae]MCR6593369.1 conjugal transfer protein TraB [Campylobacter insulaenigrae]VEJ53246.1 sex pilus assembly protein [Campylobacter insulaenigrae]